MGIPFRKRLGLTERTADTRTDRGVMARTLMYPFALGGVMSLVAAPGNPVHFGVVATVCWSVAALLLATYDAMPHWSFPFLTALGTGLLLWTVHAGAGSALACSPLLVLPATYAMFFLRKVAAVTIAALASGGYVAAALAGPASGSHVVVAGVGIAAAAGLVGLQRANANRLIWRLSDAAVTDALTGLMNRRGFQELIETELERARRSGQPLSLIIGDLDHFKALNDRFGHGAGDRALEQLALILDTAKRRIDTAARIGGEEFAVVLPDSDHHAAYILAERTRREVRETFMYEPYELTISLGVATFPLHGTSVETLVAQADEALYAAKALGRDRSVVWGESLDDDVLEQTGLATPRSERHGATLRAPAEVIDQRERGSGANSQAVARYAAGIALGVGLSGVPIECASFGGLLPDGG